MTLTTTAIVPYFGCARMIAPQVGKALRGCPWVGIPFGGGMPEVSHIRAPSIVVGDVHRNVINLARVLADPQLGPRLIRRLRRKAFHPDELSTAQSKAASWEQSSGALSAESPPDLDAAESYFVSQWMGRSAKAGTGDEFTGKLPIRWNAGGGDSNTRYRSATRSLLAWRRVFERCNFTLLDAFTFLDRVKDEPGVGIYCDPPFPGPGDRYKHPFTAAQHEHLASKVASFKRARVVMRFYGTERIRELYPETHWTWQDIAGGRKQSNAAAPEVLLVRGNADR